MTDQSPARPQNPTAAVGLMVLATVFIAGTTLCAKALGTDTLGTPLHPLQISHGRFVFAFMGLLCVAAVLRPKIKAPVIKLHISRTLCGATGVTLMSLAKGAVFGFIAALMGCYYGMNSERGAMGVGRATKSSVVAAAILILAANFLLTEAFFSA